MYSLSCWKTFLELKDLDEIGVGQIPFSWSLLCLLLFIWSCFQSVSFAIYFSFHFLPTGYLSGLGQSLFFPLSRVSSQIHCPNASRWHKSLQLPRWWPLTWRKLFYKLHSLAANLLIIVHIFLFSIFTLSYRLLRIYKQGKHLLPNSEKRMSFWSFIDSIVSTIWKKVALETNGIGENSHLGNHPIVIVFV